MEKRNDIFTELNGLSPLLAGLDKVNVFSVPDGYFDIVSTNVLAWVMEAQSAGSNSVPAGYFDNLAGSILAKIKAQTGNDAKAEINELSPLLAGYQQHNVFKVPVDYFDNLSDNIIKNTDEEVSPMLVTYRQHNVYKVPNGYFESLADDILKKTKVDMSPMLAGYRQHNVYTVPAGYFDGLADAILQKVQPSGAKVVSMPRRNNWLKYAAAAMITGALALGVYKYADQPAGTTQPDIAVVDQSNNKTQIAKLDPSIVKGMAMNDQQFDEALNNLSNDDIDQYLEQNASVADIALLTTTAEDKTMQTTEEQTLDENTLEKYLTEIELVN